jgi:hypothetical protein
VGPGLGGLIARVEGLPGDQPHGLDVGQTRADVMVGRHAIGDDLPERVAMGWERKRERFVVHGEVPLERVEWIGRTPRDWIN